MIPSQSTDRHASIKLFQCIGHSHPLLRALRHLSTTLAKQSKALTLKKSWKHFSLFGLKRLNEESARVGDKCNLSSCQQNVQWSQSGSEIAIRLPSDSLLLSLSPRFPRAFSFSRGCYSWKVYCKSFCLRLQFQVPTPPHPSAYPKQHHFQERKSVAPMRRCFPPLCWAPQWGIEPWVQRLWRERATVCTRALLCGGRTRVRCC